MAELPGVVVTGASGRMGQTLCRMLLKHPKLRLSGAVERADSVWIGRDVGEMLGGRAIGVGISADPAVAFAGARVVVDFSAPAATTGFAALAAERGVVHVIGTTGLSTADLASVSAAAKRAVIIRAGNMSLGVNLLMKLTRMVAAALDADYDIEILEMHHNRKVDAPSGTALMLGEAAAAGRGVDLAQVSDRGRDGMTGPRQRGQIGFASLRGGDAVGEHEVIFAGAGERVVLKHIATDRALFARGALRAAVWGLDQPPGEYDMLDVLGLAG